MTGIETIGKAWTHPRTGEVRYYINDAWRFGGLEVQRHKSGNISSAWIGEEDISNSEANRCINACEKVWVTEDGQIHFQGTVVGQRALAFREQVRAGIEEALADAEAEESIARDEERLDAILASME